VFTALLLSTEEELLSEHEAADTHITKAAAIHNSLFIMIIPFARVFCVQG
jgi:hypothetical protein